MTALAAEAGRLGGGPLNMPMASADRSYRVQKGDTLWDISLANLRDPFLWPKLWQANQRIKNPDLIFPGNRILIPAELAKPVGPTEAASAPPVPAPPAEEPAETETAAAVPSVPAPVVPVAQEPQPAVAGNVWLRAMTPSIRSALAPSGKVLRAKEGFKDIMTNNDEVYVEPRNGGAFEVAQTLMFYRRIKKVYHPVSGKLLGTLIRPLAKAEVVATDSGVVVTMVRRSVDYIQKGDEVADFSNMAEEEAGGATGGTPVTGVVAEVENERLLIDGGDLVFLDRGKNAGVKSGDRLTVIRTGDTTSGCCSLGKRIKVPDYPIGEVEVLSAQGETSTAVLLKTSEIVAVGDRVVSSK